MLGTKDFFPQGYFPIFFVEDQSRDHTGKDSSQQRDFERFLGPFLKS